MNYRLFKNGQKSLADARKRLKHLDPFFQNEKAVQITTSKVNEYIKKPLEDGAENRTVNRELAALKTMLRLGAKETPPRVDRVPYIPKLEEGTVRSGFFEEDTFEDFHGWFLKNAPNI